MELREQIRDIIDGCYEARNPDYPKLRAFQPEKFLNELLELNLIQLDENQRLPPIPRDDILHIILERDAMLLNEGFRRVKL